MKKLPCLLVLTAIALSFVMFAAGCSLDKQEYPPYQDVAQLPADKEAYFASDLPDNEVVYPSGTGRTFYVAANGNDNNSGRSKGRPLKTLNAVNALDLRAGDTVCFRGGDTFYGVLSFTDIAGTEQEPITFCSYNNDKAPAHIRCKKYTAQFKRCSNIVIRDLEFEGNDIDYSLDKRGGGVVSHPI